MSRLYSRTLLDHFLRPRNVGVLADPSGVGRAINRACSDVVSIYIHVDDAGTLDRVTFKAQGCAACIAAASVITELATGRTVEEADGIGKDAVIDALEGVPEHKVDCSMISPTALREALRDYRQKCA